MPSQLLSIEKLSRPNLCGDGYFLHPLDILISPGDCIGIGGTSGSGKSILLRAIAQIDNVNYNKINFLNNKIDDSRIPFYRTQVQLIQQHTVLFNGSVEDNIRFPHTFFNNKNRNYNWQEIHHALDFFQLPHDFLQQHSNNLSGGERHIVNLLRSLSLSPHILLLDEPTAALDHKAAQRIEDFIHHWLSEKADERAYLWISHSAEQIQRIAHQFWYVDNGIVSMEYLPNKVQYGK